MTEHNLEFKLISQEERNSKEFKNKNPFDSYPMMETSQGNLFETFAICNVLAKTGKNYLAGKSWLDEVKIL